MKIDVYLKKDLTVFAGNIDGKEFNFTVEEFINLIGAFQKSVANAKGIELPEKDIISTKNAGKRFLVSTIYTSEDWNFINDRRLKLHNILKQ